MFVRSKAVALAATAVVSLTALAACGSDDDSDASGSSTIRYMSYAGTAVKLPYLAAVANGYFEEAGIKVENVNQPDGIPGVQGLISTKSDVGQFSVATAAQANQAGEDVRFFCGTLRVVQSTLFTKADSDLPSVEDGATYQEVLAALKGKKVGVQAPKGSGFQLLLQGALEANGADGVTYVNVGGSNAQADAALQSGSLDAAISSPPGTQNYASTGEFKVLAYLPDGPTQYKDYYGSGFAAEKEWLDKNPETAKKFCEAATKAIAYIKDPANVDAVTDLLVKESKLPEEIARTVVTDTLQQYSETLPKDAFDLTLKGYLEYGVVKPEPAVTYDNIVEDLTGN